MKTMAAITKNSVSLRSIPISTIRYFIEGSIPERLSVLSPFSLIAMMFHTLSYKLHNMLNM